MVTKTIKLNLNFIITQHYSQQFEQHFSAAGGHRLGSNYKIGSKLTFIREKQPAH